MFRKHFFPIFYSILLTAFTVYMFLDTFVITRVYAAVPSAGASSAVEAEAKAADTEEDSESQAKNRNGNESTTTDDEDEVFSQSSTARSAVSTETAYQDENISVTITEYREYDTSIYVADILLSDLVEESSGDTGTNEATHLRESFPEEASAVTY